VYIPVGDQTRDVKGKRKNCTNWASMTSFVLAKGTHQMPGRLWISIGRYQDRILRLPRDERKLILEIREKEEVGVGQKWLIT
jgi:hypothetical protein